jgi:hypothetical protein
MDLEALNIAAYQTATDANNVQLMSAARHVCEALSIAFSSERWVRLIKWMRSFRRVRADKSHVDNRMLWATALAASRGEAIEADMDAVRPLICFLAAFMDGTGSVERQLGRHAAFLESHERGGGSGSVEACRNSVRRSERRGRIVQSE